MSEFPHKSFDNWVTQTPEDYFHYEEEEKQSKKGKWQKIGIDKEKYRSIYENFRMKAYLILKKRHKKEYKEIMKKLLKNKYNQEVKTWTKKK